jgi:GNAT superfamily N-acetyltransferase
VTEADRMPAVAKNRTPKAEASAPVVVRQSVLADLDELAALFDQYRQFQGQHADLPACRAFLHQRFEHGDSVLFLATRGGQAVGMAQLYPSWSSTALARVFILNDLFVAATGRRAGVASALLAAVEQHAASFGACRVSLNVAQGNGPAQDLYRARGWVKDNEFFMFHRLPARP